MEILDAFKIYLLGGKLYSHWIFSSEKKMRHHKIKGHVSIHSIRLSSFNISPDVFKPCGPLQTFYNLSNQNETI